MGNSTMDQGATKEKIRSNALRLFKEYGYGNVTVVQICAASGVSKRTFYYHFSSKDEIVDGIVGHIGRQAEVVGEAMLHQESNVGILWSMMRSYAVDAEENGSAITSQVYINILQRGAVNSFPQDMLLYHAAIRNIENAQHAEEIGNMQHAEDVAYVLYHALRSVVYTWSSCGGAYSLLDEYKRVFQAVLSIQIPPEKAFGQDA